MNSGSSLALNACDLLHYVVLQLIVYFSLQDFQGVES